MMTEESEQALRLYIEKRRIGGQVLEPVLQNLCRNLNIVYQFPKIYRQDILDRVQGVPYDNAKWSWISRVTNGYTVNYYGNSVWYDFHDNLNDCIIMAYKSGFLSGVSNIHVNILFIHYDGIMSEKAYDRINAMKKNRGMTGVIIPILNSRDKNIIIVHSESDISYEDIRAGNFEDRVRGMTFKEESHAFIVSLEVARILDEEMIRL